MSINWNWNDKMGKVTDERGFVSNLYRGNCFMIAINEFTNNEGIKQYSLAWFFADETHLKNCLGLTKEYKENSINDYHWKEFELNTEYAETWKFAKLIASQKLDKPITIKFYTEKKGRK